MTEAVEPFSNSVQIGLRVPVIVIALAGVVLALVLLRRIGAPAAILGALGSLVVAVDQIVNIAWVLHLSSLADVDGFDADGYNTTNNAYTVADPLLITLGVALLIAAVVTKRPAAGAPAPQPGQFPPPFPPQQPQFPQPPQQPFPPQPPYGR